jgi:hypothetical protein
LSAGLPPLSSIRRGLRHATEALAVQLAMPAPESATPDWTDLQWRLALAAAAAHGVSPLLAAHTGWQHPCWNPFLAEQRAHVEARHRRIATLLERIDAGARAASVSLVALKGSALHALGVYTPGERPMADIDLLVAEADLDAASGLLKDLGYVESFAHWRHRAFKPAVGAPTVGLGEHRDTPVNIELHTRIQERLPIATVDITARVPLHEPGIQPYPSHGALMCHLLLHAAGNICGRSIRLLHLHDIALLAARMDTADWDVLWTDGSAWWAFPPLALVSRYYPGAIPPAVVARLDGECHGWLRRTSRRRTLTQLSCSALWAQALPGIEWARTMRDIGRAVRNRFRLTEENVQERADLARTQLWLQGQAWVKRSHGRRILTRLTRPVPRMDTLYVVRAALGYGVSRPG